jgi:hypothetical protein|tara:strand:- start:2242 stop:2826 length:585 start_codon:yes stop_codon:yes gene_type:complete
MKNLKYYTYGTLLLAAGLAFYLVNSIKFSIDEEARINEAEAKVIEKLKMIRSAQIAFQSVNGQFASEWDTLLNFIDSGNIFLIQRREETVLLDYGAEETTLYLDTLGSVTVIDSLFSSIPNFVASNLINVPGYENVQFEIWASKIEKGGVEVDVVEVRNPKPFDPNRKESNEANINKPLRFGSRTSITTAGNWE